MAQPLVQPEPEETLDEAEIEALVREAEDQAAAGLAPEESTEEPELTLQQQFAQMRMSEKVKLALLGPRAARALAIRTNKPLLVQMALKNPRITLDEVMELAKLKSTATEILNVIQANRVWMKSYQLKIALVTNPKTPPGVAMRLLRHLQTGDLRRLAKSRDVPQIVSNTARRLMNREG